MVGQKRTSRVLSRRVANLRRAAAHQDNRLVARLLQRAQHHDLDEGADMEAVCGAVKADIGGHDLLRGLLVEALEVGRLMNVSTFGENADQLGFVAHDTTLGAGQNSGAASGSVFKASSR
jgi:hypothetical protein